MNQEIAGQFLLYCVLPLWLAAGTADALCHRWSDLPNNAGVRESLMHVAQLAEGAGLVLCALFLTINAFAICTMAALIDAHEFTVYFDLRYAGGQRVITPVEQMVHSVLEMAPIMGFAIVCLSHPDALASVTHSNASFAMAPHEPPLPPLRVATVLLLCLLFGVAPYAMELASCIRASRMKSKARR
ncbi:hypothetical protein AWB76_04873 [Caballeronia temeraria]|uniref:Diguanylate cyclase n=1 Tax=Caballeronia temeraria TaxID=1777137 RepID=A0A158BYP8_9BURK|nr:hypothetical protein [Caballeronia temeraria]SAK75229.1 hypothetical protein AWB76_04873 [Caballeronia temeraria]